jgi:hypothetical protein
MNNNLEFENTDPSPDSVEDNYPRTNYGEGYYEEPKQETIEEREPYWDLVDKKAEQNNTIDLDAYAKGVQDGAKWQAKRMYSEEEVIELIKKAVYQKQNAWKVGELDKWFEQFKKNV